MKYTMKRVLALIIALMLAVPGIAFSEEPRVDEVAIDADAALEDVVLEEEISAEDVDLPVGEDGEASLYDLTDIDPGAQLTGDEPEEPAPVAFDQTVTVGDVEVTVVADAGAIPAGARLSVTEIDAHIAQAAMQSIEAMLGSAVTHHLYSIAVLDAGGNPLALNADMALPLVCVKGLPLDGDVRAFVYDPALDGSYEIDMEGEGQFRFQESATYDIVEAGYPDAEEEPVEQELSTVEQPVDQEQPADEQEQPADEQEQPADEQEQPADEQGQPADEQEQPADEQEQPADEQGEQPADEQEQPADEQEQPADEQEQPADEQEQPADEQEQPADEQEQPDDEQGEQSEDAQGEQPVDEQPVGLVTVIFDTTPETAVITVKSEDEVILPEEDGSYLLSAGEYTYTAEADGYVSVENEPFTVSDETASDATVISDDAVLPDDAVSSNDHTASNEPMIITVVLEAVEAEAVEAEPVAFDQSMTVDGVVVTVKADPGVFPATAALSVEQVPVYMQRQADAAIEDVRDEDANVAVSYTFDIKVIDPETGEEIQPAEGQSVSVGFSLAEVADENLETQVYHVTEDAGELSAEALDVTTLETVGDSTAVVETDGFSIYTIEFIYRELQYVLPGYSSVALGEILDAVDLTGEVTAVEISDTSLFSASNETGEWIVTAHQAFSSTEWMKVTINGVTYEITVTDNKKVSVTFHATDGWYDYNDEQVTDRTEWCVPGDRMFMLDGDLIPNNEEGQVFRGWATEEDGDVVYTWSDDDDEENWTVADDGGEFYAVWGDGVKVTFHGTGGKYYDEEGEHADCIWWWIPGERMYMLADYLIPNPDHENQAFLGWATEENGEVVFTWSDDDNDENWTVADNGGEFYAVWGDGVIVRFHAGENGTYHDDRGREYDTEVAVWMPGEWHNLLDEDWLCPDEDEGKRLMGWKDSEGHVIAWDGEEIGRAHV